MSLIEGERDCGEQIIWFGLDHKWRGLCIRPITDISESIHWGGVLVYIIATTGRLSSLCQISWYLGLLFSFCFWRNASCTVHGEEGQTNQSACVCVYERERERELHG